MTFTIHLDVFSLCFNLILISDRILLYDGDCHSESANKGPAFCWEDHPNPDLHSRIVDATPFFLCREEQPKSIVVGCSWTWCPYSLRSKMKFKWKFGQMDRLPSTRLGGSLCLLINGQDTMLPSVPEEVDPLSVWIIELGLFRYSVEVTDHFVFDVCMQYVVSWGRVDELKICSFRVSSLQDDHIFLGQAEV